MSELTINPPTQTFLEEETNLILATVRGDGSPQMSPVWYLWEDGKFVISTITRTAKWWNLKRDPRCSVCVDDPVSGKMVVAYGVAELDDGDVWDKTWDLVAKYREPKDVQEHMDRIFKDVKRVLVSVPPDNIVTRLL
jgi:PPOX class probable F420-dependent enzyme